MQILVLPLVQEAQLALVHQYRQFFPYKERINADDTNFAI